MDRRFWAIIGVIVVLFGGILVVNSKKTGSNSSANGAKPTSHYRGSLTSKVTLTEYGDYECPVCEGYAPAIQQVQQKYNDTVRFQFRNLPLSSIHPNAFAAARAAEAADMQGKFWQMHDTLYNQTNWQEWSTSSNTTPFFKNYAGGIGLNVTKFEKDFASMAVNNRINADLDAFKKTGEQQGTPTFFINGKYYANSNFVDQTGAPSLTAFSKVLDTALKNAK